MKNLFFIFFFTSPFFALSQSVTADPALEPMKITTLVNSPVINTQLPINGIIQLKVPILNKNISNALPAGTCKIKIGLGSKLILDPLFNLSNVNTSNYFTWSVLSSGGQMQITGDLTGELPLNFSDTAYFYVKGIILGTSTITTNFLVTNHNSNITLSDENGANNIASLAYTITNAVVPVTFTNIYAENKDCSLNVHFNTENEINVSKYELQVSSNFNDFEKIATLQACGVKHYIFQSIALTKNLQLPVLLVRVKSIDVDGKFQYSEIKKISSICNSNTILTVYPNPISKNNANFFVQKEHGLFNGTYQIVVTDMGGSKIKSSEIKLHNIVRFNYSLSNVASGQFIIKIYNNLDHTIDFLKILIQ